MDNRESNENVSIEAREKLYENYGEQYESVDRYSRKAKKEGKEVGVRGRSNGREE